MKKLSVSLGVVVLGALSCRGPAGPEGPPGPVNPTAGLITPNSGFLARSVNVTVSGEALAFDQTPPTFDFGANVTVSNIQVVDPDSATATLAIGSSASVGPRDVKITAAGTTLTATNGFAVQAPLVVTPTQFLGMSLGQPEQGGVGVFSIHNLDADNQLAPCFLYLGQGSLVASNFCPTTTVCGQPTAASGTGTDVIIGVLFDPLATPGPSAIELANPNLDGTAGLTFYADPNTVNLTARSPTKLAPGTVAMPSTTTGSIAKLAGTGLYELTTTGPIILSLSVSPADTLQLISPRMRVYGADGLSDQLIDDETGSSAAAYSGFPLAKSGSIYLIVADASLSGGIGYNYTLSASAMAVANVDPSGATPHGTPATAQVETARCIPGPCIISGNIASATQVDAFLLALGMNDTVTAELWRDNGTSIAATLVQATGSQFDSCGPAITLEPTAPSNVSCQSTGGPPGQGNWYLVVANATTTTPAPMSTGNYVLAIGSTLVCPGQ
jgi:hypothetical protein